MIHIILLFFDNIVYALVVQIPRTYMRTNTISKTKALPSLVDLRHLGADNVIIIISISW